MGAVSYINHDQQVIKHVGIDLSIYSGGYIDKWGSSFKLSLENGRVMFSLDQLGGCLSESGWKDDSTLKEITEGTFTDGLFQWNMVNSDDPQMEYVIVNNELLALVQCGVVLWKAKSVKSVTALTRQCLKYSSGFFTYFKRTPYRLAFYSERKYGIKPQKVNESTYGTPSVQVSYAERTGSSLNNFYNSWLKAIGIK